MKSEAGRLTILIPLDGSRLAESVLPAAEALARRFRSRFSLVHVIEKGTPATVHGERHLASVPEAKAYLSVIAERLRPLAAEIASHVHEEEQGDVAKSIVEHADEIDADLVLLCSHGRGGLRDLLFGSIAQQAMRWGRRSILLIQPQPGEPEPGFEIRRILVPLDGSAAHEPSLPTALRMAAGFSAEIRLLVVIPTLGTLSGEQARSARTLPGTMRAVLELAQEGGEDYLQDAVQRVRALGLGVSGEIVRGDPVPTVVEVAAKWEADLIVLASHGRRGLDALFSGSVAPRLTDRLERPLLLVKAGPFSKPDA
jgi:nucleotide-binding universal stress UspA family protein